MSHLWLWTSFDERLQAASSLLSDMQRSVKRRRLYRNPVNHSCCSNLQDYDWQRLCGISGADPLNRTLLSFVHGWAFRLRRPTRPGRPPWAHPELFPPSAVAAADDLRLAPEAVFSTIDRTRSTQKQNRYLHKWVSWTSSDILVQPLEGLLPD